MGEVKAKLFFSDFFEAVLLELVGRTGKTEFPIDRIKWHQAFYDAIQKYRDELPDFEVRKTTFGNPHVYNLEHSIESSLLIGELFEVGENTYQVKILDRLKADQEANPEPQRQQLREVAMYICDRLNSR